MTKDTEEKLVEKMGETDHHWWKSDLINPKVLERERIRYGNMLTAIKPDLVELFEVCRVCCGGGADIMGMRACDICKGRGIVMKEAK
jgi:hypothetical protein